MTPQQNTDNGLYRATYHSTHDYIYSAQNAGSSTGAVPRTQQWHNASRSEEPNKTQRQYQPEEPSTNNQMVCSVTIETQKEQKDGGNKNTKSMTKTYHTLKDMISSRFKGKDNENDNKNEEPGLNNVAEELRKSVRSVDRLTEEIEDQRVVKKPAGEQGIYGKPRTEQRPDGIYQQQYHLMQQQLLHNQQMQLQTQQLQQYQQQQQFKNQQQIAGQIQIVQSRSQEMLAPRPHQLQDVYYHSSAYGATPQRRYHQDNQTYVMMHHPQFGEVKVSREVINERAIDVERRPIEPRSPQQIERDNIRRKSFEARRAASQPQLAFDDETNNKPRTDNSNQLINQLLTPIRRGSHGNLIESINTRNNPQQESEKDSDDGGFIQKEKDRKDEEQTIEVSYAKEEAKVIESLTGTPRKKLEGEIGKIEGVYNVGQRVRQINGGDHIDMDKRRKPNGSGASSDYDKTGGQSSNADSGRGSAAYSSGRRMGNDTSTESSDIHQLPSTNYASTIAPGKIVGFSQGC